MDWPEDDKPADFEQLLDAVRNAFDQGVVWERNNRNVDVLWTGPPVPKSMAHVSMPYDLVFSAERLKWNEDNHDRDFVDAIITTAIQLGIEQGRRCELERIEFERMILKMRISKIKENVDQIANNLENPLVKQ